MVDHIEELARELAKWSRFDEPPALRPRPTVADYDHDLSLRRRPWHDMFGHLRDLVLIGIRVGTISVEDVFRRVRPAMVALSVLLDEGAGQTASDLIHRIRQCAGEDTERWAEAIIAVDSWPGSLHNLMRRSPPEADSPAAHTVLGLDEHLWRGANILLALAPPGTLAHLADETAVRVAGHAPLSRGIVDHALDPETSSRLRIALAGNPLTPNAILLKLLAFTDSEPGIATAMCLHECAPPAIRLAAYREVSDPGIRARARERLQRDAAVVRRVEQIAAAADHEAPLVHRLIREAGPDLPVEARLFAYARLARMSSLEAVWALEMERAGSLAAMHPAVRATMESGSPGPLIEAAVAEPYRGVDQDSVTSLSASRRVEVLDWPFPVVPPGGQNSPP
jgi:hypothetical protein